MDLLSLGAGIGAGLVVGAALFIVARRGWAQSVEILQSAVDQARIEQEEADRALSEGQLALRQTEARAAAAQARFEEAQRRVSELSTVELTAREWMQKSTELETRLESERRLHTVERDRLQQFVTDVQTRLQDSFTSTSNAVVQSSTDRLLQLAQTQFSVFHEKAVAELAQREQTLTSLVAPLQASLQQMDVRVQGLDQAREQAFGALRTEVASLMQQTRVLGQALTTPHVRGAWGELHLRRVVELAGLHEYVDFDTQVHTASDEGAARPDLLIRLPEGRVVVIDAKVPLQAYLHALETTEPELRKTRLRDHARSLRGHVLALSRRRYPAKIHGSIDLTVLYVPGESFLGAALEADPSLLEDALAQGVALTSPTALFSVLRSVAQTWSQHQLLENVESLRASAQRIADRARTLVGHVDDVGKALGRSVDAYNKCVGSLDERLMPELERFRALGAVSGPEFEAPLLLTGTTRPTRHLPAGE